MKIDLTSFENKLKYAFNKDELKMAFDKQFDLYSKTKAKANCNLFDENFNIPENTLIHGTMFDEDTLLSIKENGILSSDFIGLEEVHEETFYHADFFRVDKNLTLFQYFLEMNGCRDWNGCNFSPIKPFGTSHSKNYIDVSNCRLPFLWDNKSKHNVAFLINGNNDDLKKFQKYDFYRGSPVCDSLVNKKATNCFYGPQMSAIFFGVPSSLFSAIVVGSSVELEEKKLNFLKNTFSNLPILSSGGELIYVPKEQKEHYNVDKIKQNFNKEMNNFCDNIDADFMPKSNFTDAIYNNTKTM